MLLSFGSFCKKKTYEYVDQSQLLRTYGVTHDQFLDACLLAGFDQYSSTLPILQQQYGTTATSLFAGAIELVKTYSSGYAAINCDQFYFLILTCTALLYQAPFYATYMDSYLAASCLFRHHLTFQPPSV